MQKKVAYSLCLLIILFSFRSPAFAASKSKKPKPITVGISQATVNVVVKKKQVSVGIYCYKKHSGQIKKIKGGYSFTTYSTMATLKPTKAPLYKALNKAGKTACASGGGSTPVANPNVQIPDHLSMAAYTGPFGEEQAHILFDRFGFSASPQRIQQAVQDSLATTITKLTTYLPEPGIDAIENNMRCNGLLPGDVRNGTANYTCDASDPNDIDIGGLKSAMLYRHYYTQNQFFDKLEFFIRDRFQSVNTRVIGGCRTWSVIPYVNLVRRAARSGDYVQYLRDFGTDYMSGIVWMHLLGSSYVSPNEDEAREILQLGGTGPYNLDGTPVYGDLDVAQNALALTGWVDTSYTDNNGHRICVPAFSQNLHAPGPQRLFIGTPYESQISNLEDVIQAIRRHPRMGEYIAENIWEEFINPYETPDSIRSLAAIVRSTDYNLVATMKVVMGSKAVFAAQSKKSIPKQPLDVLMGFLRVSGLPVVYDYYWLRNTADDLGQLDLSPNTVFGWRNRDALAGEGFVLNRRNALIGLLNQDIDDLRDKGFTYWDRFLQGLPSDGTASTHFVNRLQSWFNIHLNANQVATLVQYLDYDQHTCNQYTNCAAGQTTYLERNQFDPAVDASDEGRASNSYKTRGAIAMLTMMPDFMMK